MVRLLKFAAIAALFSLSAVAQPPVATDKPAVKAPAPVNRRKPNAAKVKEPPPPPQPVAIPQMTPEQLPAQPPQVSFRNGQLSVVSQNATLGDVLNAIRQQTGAQVETVPGAAGERVAVRLSGTPREVISDLLAGSKFGYIIVGPPGDPDGVQRIMLTTNAAGPTTPGPAIAGNRPGAPPPPQQAYVPPADYTPDVEEEPPDAITDRTPLPPDAQPPQMPPQVPPGTPEAGQPPSDQVPNPYVGGEQPRFGQPAQIPPNPQQPNQQNPDQPQIKTPDQLLQELQRLRQRQLQSNPPQQ